MIVVADASPLIFLGKVGQLDLLPGLFPGELLLTCLVQEEVLARPCSPAEQRALQTFLSRTKVLEMANQERFATGLSRSDTASLALAIRESADLLLADDRLLRRIAELEGTRPMGTLGILLRARSHGLLTATETRSIVSELVQQHQFRIGIEVFEAFLRELDL